MKKKNITTNSYHRYIFIMIVIVIAIALISNKQWLFNSEYNDTVTHNTNQQLGASDNTTIEIQVFNNFIDALDNNSTSPEDTPISTEDSALISDDSDTSELTKRKQQYQQLFSDLANSSGDNKLLTLEELWKLAPEVGIEDNFLTSLELAKYDPDEAIQNMANVIHADLIRFKNNQLTPVQDIVQQLESLQSNTQVNTGHDLTDNLHTPETTDPTHEVGTSSKIGRSRLIEQLSDLALTSVDTDTRHYALNSLIQYEQDTAIDILQNKLAYSRNRDERVYAIELLTSILGNSNDDKVREIIHHFENDYDEYVSHIARLSLINSNQDIAPVSEVHHSDQPDELLD